MVTSRDVPHREEDTKTAAKTPATLSTATPLSRIIDDQYGARRITRDPVGDASDEKTSNARETSPADEDEIGSDPMSRVDNSLGGVGAFDDQHFDGDRLAARTLYKWSAALFVKAPCFVQGGLALRIGFGMFAYAGYGYKLHACLKPARNLYGVVERATSACRAVPGDQDV